MATINEHTVRRKVTLYMVCWSATDSHFILQKELPGMGWFCTITRLSFNADKCEANPVSLLAGEEEEIEAFADYPKTEKEIWHERGKTSSIGTACQHI